MTQQISDLNWEKRIIIISYKKQSDELFTKSIKYISDNKCGINDRNIEIIFFENFNCFITESKTVFFPFNSMKILPGNLVEPVLT